MNKNTLQLIAGAVIGLPLVAFALFGTQGGPLFAKVASAGYGQEKVTLCHKGNNTLTVGAPAAQAHYNHGDTPGACPTTPAPTAAPQKNH